MSSILLMNCFHSSFSDKEKEIELINNKFKKAHIIKGMPQQEKKEKIYVKEKYPTIIFMKDSTVIKKLYLPIDEIKNIEFNGFLVKNDTVEMKLTWGSFNVFHENKYVFIIKKDKLFLKKIYIKIYERGNEIEKRNDSIIFKTEIPIRKINLKRIYEKYIENL